MFVLWGVGGLVERLVGNTGFAVLYFLSGAGGSLASLSYHPLLVSAGASGAVFGVYGALIALLVRQSGAVPAETLAGLRNAGLAFVGYNLLFGLMVPQIDNAAHIGGLVTGFVCGLVLNQPLERASVAKRPARNVLAAMLGAILLTAGAVTTQVLYADLPTAVSARDEFDQVRKRLVETDTALRKQHRAGQLPDAAFANQIERSVLPDWRASAQRIEPLHRVPAETRDILTRVLKYMRLHQEAWELEVQALREGSKEKWLRAELLHQAAEDVVKR
jgi:rhomboid protease GluP